MRFPVHFWIGVVTLALSEGAMLAHVEPFWTWHTPFAWTGYILILDGIIYTKRRSSWLTRHFREFVFLAFMSIPLWVVFEGYNLLIKNWYYINLPDNLLLRYFGYAWAFATVSPGIFQTAELVAILRGARRTGSTEADAESRRLLRVDYELATADYVSVVFGAAMLLLPIIWPSPYLAAPVFLGFIFLLDPINAWSGDDSLLARFPERHIRTDDESAHRGLHLRRAVGVLELLGASEVDLHRAHRRQRENLRNAGSRVFRLPAVRPRMLRHVRVRPASVLAWIAADDRRLNGRWPWQPELGALAHDHAHRPTAV